MQYNVKTNTTMSIFPFLQLQQLEPTDDGSISDLDSYEQDETIDLSQDITEQELEQNFANLLSSDVDQINFGEE